LKLKRSLVAVLGVALVGAIAPTALGGGEAVRSGGAQAAPAAGPAAGGLEGAAAARSTAAARAGKTRVYKGWFPDVSGSKAKLTTTFRRGKPKLVTQIDYWRLPAVCEKTGGGQTASWGFRFIRGALRVNPNRKFGVSGSAEDGSTVRISGRFSRNFKKVRGKFQTRTLFPKNPDAGYPEEFCTIATQRFRVKR